MTEDLKTGRSKSTITEKAVLGAMLVSPDIITDVVSKLSADSFFDVENRIIFEAILKLNDDNTPVDLISVAEQLKQSGKIEEAGNYSYLAELTNQSGLGIARIEYYCKILLQLQVERLLIDMSMEIIRMSDGTNDVSDTISFADRQLQRINDVLSCNNRMEHISTAIEKAADESIIRGILPPCASCRSNQH